ncbi:MAG: GlxA family transcriptional regulator [Flexibacteraceae bacterium]
MKVVIPVFKDCVSASVIGMMDMLMLTQNFYRQFPNADKPWFNVKLLSLEPELLVQNNGFEIKCDEVFNENTDADLCILPAIVGHLPSLLQTHSGFVAWIKRQFELGKMVSSTCNGAFFLAASGILDGKEATTSWFAANDFRQMFPKVKLIDEKIIVDNGKTITGGATLSFQYICIYLIEKFYGKQIGNFAAKVFLVEKGKHSQLTYSVFSAQKNHNDTSILQIQEAIEARAQERIVISELAESTAMAERTFIRRFKNATGNTPSEYIQRVKVELAKKHIEDDTISIKEICYEIGYEDQTYFRNVFKKYTGLTPSEYKKQFSFQMG